MESKLVTVFGGGRVHIAGVVRGGGLPVAFGRGLLYRQVERPCLAAARHEQQGDCRHGDDSHCAFPKYKARDYTCR